MALPILHAWRLGFVVWRPRYNMCDMADMSDDLDCATGNHPSNQTILYMLEMLLCYHLAQKNSLPASELEVSQLWANNGFIVRYFVSYEIEFPKDSAAGWWWMGTHVQLLPCKILQYWI